MRSSVRHASLLAATSHRPWPLPEGPWAISMRWSDLLFAHWPVEPPAIASLLPAGLLLDLFDGAAWIGVIPFCMEGVQLRGLPPIPGTRVFPEANLRTYVHDPVSGSHGVYFFSLDAANPLAVAAARIWYNLPYYLAHMRVEEEDGWLSYRSERLFSTPKAGFQARYRAAGDGSTRSPSQPGSLEYFLTERYALFTSSRSRLVRSDVHHLPWPLEPAEAEFRGLTLPGAHGIELPAIAPVLHYSRMLDVLAWPPHAVA